MEPLHVGRQETAGLASPGWEPLHVGRASPGLDPLHVGTPVTSLISGVMSPRRMATMAAAELPMSAAASSMAGARGSSDASNSTKWARVTCPCHIEHWILNAD